MPAWILLLRIGRVPLPLPWFPVWLLLAPLLLLASLLGLLAKLLGLGGDAAGTMAEAWRVIPLVTCLHGLRIGIDGGEQRIGLVFV